MSNIIEIDGVPHVDTRDIRTKVFDEGWKVPKRQSDLPYAAEIAEREAAIAKRRREAKLADLKLTPEQRHLEWMKSEQENYLDDKERQQVLKEHLESPRVAKKLAEAKAIRAAIVADPERLVSDVIAIDRAIATYSDPDADMEAADAMLRDAKTNDEGYRLAKATVYRNEIAKLEKRFAEAMSGIEIERPKPQRIRVDGVSPMERLESLIDKMGKATGHTDEDLEVVFKARRAAVLQVDFAPAEAVLAKYADTSAPAAGLETEGGNDATSTTE